MRADRGEVGREIDQLASYTSVVVFEVWHLDGRDVTPETFRHWRTSLESVLAEPVHPRVGLIPVSEEPHCLWDFWTQWGGEGTILKDRAATYQPGQCPGPGSAPGA